MSTRFSIDGGALNLLTNTRGVIREVYLRESKVVAVRGYTQARPRRGRFPGVRSVPVRSYLQMRTSTRAVVETAAKSYREEFALQPVDLEFMKYASERNFQAIYRASALTPKGEVRKNVRLTFRQGGDEEAA